ncbi:unnamed protein product [Adineta steineri]|uniref:Uncharacterized protein n=2 Tax=Adineta steineri TaxID=433720 RepID=A0A819JLU3_9BILA|nr:unnamed protein product [Adineta steineri]CAF1297423.1 unnamed protein product [Adineta steineri]CAF3932089.1 unnamed protein product [Adineta steineri]
MTFKRLGQWSTRLYIVSLITSIALIMFYVIIWPQTLTKTVNKPSLHAYNDLIKDHANTLECPCTFISSIYDQFIKIEPVFHQICSSPFASDEWRRNVTANIAPDLFPYALTDYRRFFSAHFHFLTELCQTSMQSINTYVNQFLSSLWVSAQLLPQTTFHTRIDSLIEQNKLDASKSFSQFLSLLRSTNHRNAFISTYGTNYDYILNRYDAGLFTLSRTQAKTYDGNCSCALNSNCTIQAHFVKMNSSDTVPIKGLKMGCTPSESFFASTLECFYDPTCIDLIYEQMNYPNNNNSIPLSIPMNQFSVNTTMIDLINNLFVQDWLTTVNYSSYFEQCSPYMCSYTYVEKINSIYMITLLLSLYGGLTIVFKWICPLIVQLVFKLSYCWKKKRNIVVPESTIEMSTVQTNITSSDFTSDRNRTTDLESIPTVLTYQ